MATGKVFFRQVRKANAVELDHFVAEVFEDPAHDAVPAGVQFDAHLVRVVAREAHLVRLDEAVVEHEAFEDFIEVVLLHFFCQ